MRGLTRHAQLPRLRAGSMPFATSCMTLVRRLSGSERCLFTTTHMAARERAQYSAAPEALSSSAPRAKSVTIASTVPPSALSLSRP